MKEDEVKEDERSREGRGPPRKRHVGPAAAQRCLQRRKHPRSSRKKVRSDPSKGDDVQFLKHTHRSFRFHKTSGIGGWKAQKQIVLLLYQIADLQNL
jgi:hypothetical protein